MRQNVAEVHGLLALVTRCPLTIEGLKLRALEKTSKALAAVLLVSY